MRKKIMLTVILIIGLIHSQSLGAIDEWPVLKGPYFGQKPPGEVAELFMDGIVSTRKNAEMCAAFARDAREFYFNAKKRGHWVIVCTKEQNGEWTVPKPMAFSSNYTDRDFTISPDGKKIYFGSNRPRKKGGQPQKSLDIFMIKRLNKNTWSQPENLGSPINTAWGENYPSIASNGNLYFFSCKNEGSGGCEIYLSVFSGGKYSEPKNLGPAINSSKNDWDSFIAPDESYIIFSSQNRDDTLGGQDLYISYREKNGAWAKARNMGKRVNSFSGEICPSVTPDGRYLFFTSRRRGKADIYWVDARIIQKLRPKDDLE